MVPVEELLEEEKIRALTAVLTAEMEKAAMVVVTDKAVQQNVGMVLFIPAAAAVALLLHYGPVAVVLVVVAMAAVVVATGLVAEKIILVVEPVAEHTITTKVVVEELTAAPGL